MKITKADSLERSLVKTYTNLIGSNVINLNEEFNRLPLTKCLIRIERYTTNLTLEIAYNSPSNITESYILTNKVTYLTITNPNSCYIKLNSGSKYKVTMKGFRY